MQIPHTETHVAETTVEELLENRGLTIVPFRQDRRSSNKFLGSEHPKSKINPNGYVITVPFEDVISVTYEEAPETTS